MILITESLKVKNKSVNKKIYDGTEYSFYNVSLNDGEYTNNFSCSDKDVFDSLKEGSVYQLELGFIPARKDKPCKYWISGIFKG